MANELEHHRSSGGLTLRTSCLPRPSLGCRIPATIPAKHAAYLCLVVLCLFFRFESRAAGLTNVVVLELEHVVEVASGGNNWQPARTNQVLQTGDRLRTGAGSRALVRLNGVDTRRLGEFTTIELPRRDPDGAGFSLLRGILYFLHRDKPTTQPIRVPPGLAVIRGTDFVIAVAETGRTTVSVLDGEVELLNEIGRVSLNTGDEGVMEPGQLPRRSPMLQPAMAIQWALYYPAILDPDELGLSPIVTGALTESLAHYRAGALVQALDSLPPAPPPGQLTDAERIYRAALFLSVGQVEASIGLVNGLSPLATSGQVRLAAALRMLIATVNGQGNISEPHPSSLTPAAPSSVGEGSGSLATEWLAISYARQARADLEGARTASHAATDVAPRFGFGWVRLAELEFSFGRTTAALAALAKSIELAPRHGQAAALHGFLLAAQGRTKEAVAEFERAIALDGALGNAWLGRGLSRIRLGDAEAGREDLQVAATLEPQRALLRSYLGKAFSHARDSERARRELELARRVDPNDPTGWLYSALVAQNENQINEAVRHLERAQETGAARGVYRSKFLLDQDESVRGANLATVYADAGLDDVAVREAGRAVSLDYANFSAHLFLANSYDTLRDPRQITLRYETPWLSEYLVANLLAPVGAGTLSASVTQQEYARLFERNHLGFVSSTEYLSRGDWQQVAAQYGTIDRSSYSIEAAYRSLNGERPNNDFEQFTGNFRFKQEITPEDGLYLQAIYSTAEGGDVKQYYDPAEANPDLRFHEKQDPIVLAGYHHQWAPGSHSLFLAGRLTGEFRVSNPHQQTLLIDRSISGPDGVDDVLPVLMNQDYRNELEIYTAEGQQIWQSWRHTVVAGGRLQAGEFATRNRQRDPAFSPPQMIDFESDQTVTSDFGRAAAYGYLNWQVSDPLLVIGGLTYDWLQFPGNHRYGPVTADEDTVDQLSPKAGLVWTLTRHTAVRGAYTRSLGGVSFDQSFQLEPTQVAGINQSFRSLIPESVAGASSAPEFETGGLSFEHKLPTETYFGISGDVRWSDVRRGFGVYEFQPGIAEVTTPEHLDYRERSATFTIDQLLGNEWSVGGRYRISEAELHQRFTAIPADFVSLEGFRPKHDWSAVLHQAQLFGMFNHPVGLFARGEAIWYHQTSEGYTPERPGDDFWQFNLWVGYRFRGRRVEASVGLLNLTDRDYRLNPLNLYAELPRDRTLAVRWRISF